MSASAVLVVTFFFCHTGLWLLIGRAVMISIAVLIIVDVVVVVVVVVASTRIFRFFFAVPKSAAIFFFAQSAARNESGDGPSRLCFVLFCFVFKWSPAALETARRLQRWRAPIRKFIGAGPTTARTSPSFASICGRRFVLSVASGGSEMRNEKKNEAKEQKENERRNSLTAALHFDQLFVSRR